MFTYKQNQHNQQTIERSQVELKTNGEGKGGKKSIEKEKKKKKKKKKRQERLEPV